MATDVAAFAKQLREEGIEAAKQEAERIIAEAKAKAAQIVDEAKSSAAKLHQNAQEEIARKRQRSEAELKLVARDLILTVKGQIEQVAAGLLREKVAKALSTEEVVKASLIELMKNQSTGKEWEMTLGTTVGQPLAQAVVGDLFQTTGASVKLSEGFKKAGFQLKGLGGTEVVEVSDESITEAFRRLLSPELQKILDSKIEASK